MLQGIRIHNSHLMIQQTLAYIRRWHASNLHQILTGQWLCLRNRFICINLWHKCICVRRVPYVLTNVCWWMFMCSSVSERKFRRWSKSATRKKSHSFRQGTAILPWSLTYRRIPHATPHLVGSSIWRTVSAWKATRWAHFHFVGRRIHGHCHASAVEVFL